jgi:medium-chain acyl-[acyl-carrier-protein] hydrolase
VNSPIQGGLPATTATWAVRWQPAPSARLRLFCLPHAGGGTIVYRPWAQRLAPGIEVVAIRLPGRETRFREPVPGRIQDLAVGVVRAITPLLDVPYALFGHSMGALVAFEACQALRRTGLPAPTRLLVSGRPAPHLPLRHAPVHAAPTAELVARLRDYQGTRSELLDDPVALSAFISVLRADLASSEMYRYGAQPPLDCPISAFGGVDDQFAPEADLAAWESHTAAGFRVQRFPGGHFFLHEITGQFLAAAAGELNLDPTIS